MYSRVVHGCRRSFPSFCLIEFIRRVRRFSTLDHPRATNALPRPRCRFGLISKTKLMVCRTRKDAASKSQSIGTERPSIQTATIVFLALKDSQKCDVA